MPKRLVQEKKGAFCPSYYDMLCKHNSPCQGSARTDEIQMCHLLAKCGGPVFIWARSIIRFVFLYNFIRSSWPKEVVVGYLKMVYIKISALSFAFVSLLGIRVVTVILNDGTLPQTRTPRIPVLEAKYIVWLLILLFPLLRSYPCRNSIFHHGIDVTVDRRIPFRQ